MSTTSKMFKALLGAVSPSPRPNVCKAVGDQPYRSRPFWITRGRAMQIFKPSYRWPASAAGIIALMIASGVAAQTPSCDTTLTADTVLDSDMTCPFDTAIFMTGMSSNDVTLDCAGFSITTGPRAIRINGVSGATVKNCTIVTNRDRAQTVQVLSSSAIVITGNDLTTTGNVSHAVQFVDTSNSDISDNSIATVGEA